MSTNRAARPLSQHERDKKTIRALCQDISGRLSHNGALLNSIKARSGPPDLSAFVTVGDMGEILAGALLAYAKVDELVSGRDVERVLPPLANSLDELGRAAGDRKSSEVLQLASTVLMATE